jgi:hypothetical protein
LPDFRIAETAPEHRKLRAAGPAAIGLWAMAGAYAMGSTQMTDGWVPAYWVATWPSGKRLAGTLVKVGLWQPEERDGLPGWQFHDWAQIQRLASEVEQEKRKARERMQAVRKRPATAVSSRNVRPNTNGTYDRTQPERAENVHDSLSLSLSLGGTTGGGVTTTRARENPPPPRCPQHVNADGDPGPCRACGDARQAREAWDADADRREAARRSAEAREAAEVRARAIAACDRCDDRGYRGKTLCDHDPDAEARHARGSAAARAELDAALTNVRERRRTETSPATEEDRHADA